jgi:hypothetical protein
MRRHHQFAANNDGVEICTTWFHHQLDFSEQAGIDFRTPYCAQPVVRTLSCAVEQAIAAPCGPAIIASRIKARVAAHLLAP